MAAKKKKFYAVAKGRVPGIYTDWEKGAKEQVSGFAGAKYKGFESLNEAKAFLADAGISCEVFPEEDEIFPKEEKSEASILAPGMIHIFSDGGAIGNPGPGGYGVIVVHRNGDREEMSAGFSFTTNNRMELLGAIVGLRLVKNSQSEIHLTSDSSYLVNGMEKGWAENWKKRGWKKSDGKPALNADLWAELLDLVSGKSVSFHWVRGHAGHPENERCDVLAKAAAKGENLQADEGYVPLVISETEDLPGF